MTHPQEAGKSKPKTAKEIVYENLDNYNGEQVLFPETAIYCAEQYAHQREQPCQDELKSLRDTLREIKSCLKDRKQGVPLPRILGRIEAAIEIWEPAPPKD